MLDSPIISVLLSKGYLVFIRETQFFQTKCRKNCQSNNPGEPGGYNAPLLCSGKWVHVLPWGLYP